MRYKYLILLTYLICPLAPAADSLGRLFLTPDQRAQLEVTRARRDQRQPVTAEPTPAAAAAPQPQVPETITYSGLVRRSDGKSTVWINGKPVGERSRTRGAGDINVLGMQADGTVSVAIPQASRTASLRVGQRLDVSSGRIEESYAQRATTLRLKSDAPTSAVPPLPPPLALTPAPAEMPSIKESSWLARPVRESYLRIADPESGAAPAERLLEK